MVRHRLWVHRMLSQVCQVIWLSITNSLLIILLSVCVTASAHGPLPIARQAIIPAAGSFALPNSSTSPSQLSQEGTPQRLIIPHIGVNAPVEPVTITSTYALQVPHIHPFDGVGWYARGPRPGQPGNAVMDGHLDRTDGSPAVFWHLADLQPGDKIIVVDAQGHSFSFHVDRLSRYPPNQAPLEAIFGPNRGVHLNLITCAGVWIPAQRQTTLRLVVYATLDKRQQHQT